MEKSEKKRGIKELALEDRPREKMVERGAASLSISELIAILINTGTPKASAIDLARQIMDKANGRLRNLCRFDVKDLSAISGIGEKKAVTLIAAFELANRKEAEPHEKRIKVKSSNDAYYYLKGKMAHLDNEVFWVVFLNRANEITNGTQISEGGRVGTVADPRIIFKLALQHNAVSIILAHNHPSGQLFPSSSDEDLTTKLVNAGTHIDIKVLDHLIITDTGYFSFADEGKI